MESLPVLEAELQPRSPEEVVSRLLAMNAVAATAYGFDRAKAIAWLDREALSNSLSEHERRFLFESVGQPDRFKVHVEGMWALAWATGFVRELDFARLCDNDFVALFPDLRHSSSSAAFRGRARLRARAEVVAACDLAYCLHWAVRQSELSGTRLPRHLIPYVVIERRRALEWLLGTEPWDEVSLDT